MEAKYKDKQYVKFSAYGFLKNLRFFDAFILLFLIENGLSYTQIGVLYAIREIVINITEVPSGLLADTYGRKYALMFSFAVYILSFSAFYLSHQFYLFALGFALYGIADAFRSGTHKGMIIDYLQLHQWQAQKITYYGHTRSWSQRGSALSSLLAGVFVLYTGSYRSIFLLSTIPYLINLLLVGSYPNSLNLATSTRQAKPGLWVTFTAFGKVMKNKKVLSLINTSALHSAYIKAVKDYIQPLMVSIALVIPMYSQTAPEKKSGVVIGMLYFIIYMLGSQVSQLAGKAAAINKAKIAFRTLLAGFGFGVVSGLFYVSYLLVPAFIAFVGIYLIENLRKPILTGFVADSVPAAQLVSVISAQSLWRTLLTSGLAIALGVLADSYGVGFAFTFVSALLLVLSVLLQQIIPKN